MGAAMIEAQIPELADGGYWYAVPERVTEDGSREPDFDYSCCAWYDGSGFVTVRSAIPASGVTEANLVTVRSILTAAGHGSKPRGRVGGI